MRVAVVAASLSSWYEGKYCEQPSAVVSACNKRQRTLRLAARNYIGQVGDRRVKAAAP